MKLTGTVFLTCILQVFTEENIPYLQIQNIDSPKTPIESTIRVEPGDKLVLKCFVNCMKCMDRYAVRWNHNQARKSAYLRLSAAESNTYTCRHARRNLTKNVTLQVKHRKKRDDYYSNMGSINFEELMKKQTELMQRLNPDWHVLDEYLKTPSNVEHIWVDSVGNTDTDDKPQSTKMPVIKIIVIILAILVVIAAVALISYCTHLTIQKRSTTRLQQRNHRELRSLNVEPSTYRPIETQIAPYPPVVNPVQTNVSAPPPSYEEAVCNAPSAPSDGDLIPTAPRL